MKELEGRLVMPGKKLSAEIPMTEHEQGLLLAHLVHGK